MIKVLFICHGNICRSPMAEFVMKHITRNAHLEDKIYISSAATSTEELGNDMHCGTRQKLKQMGIPFEKRAARQVTKADYTEYDYLIVMDENNLRNLKRIVGPDCDKKIHMLLDFTSERGLSIADPWYTGDFDETYSDISKGCAGLLEYLRSRIQHKNGLLHF